MDSRETMPDFTRALGYHGGNINAARKLFPDAPEPWIDLSTGINPVPYPVVDFPAGSLSRLPEPCEQAALEAIAAKTYGAAPWAEIVAAPGTQAIIQWLPHIIQAQRVGILGPTYGEHEKCWRAAGAEIVQGTTLNGVEQCDVAVVVNPNNPDGRLLAPADLARVAESLEARGGTLIVDEAFMDVCALSATLASSLPANTIVLRSLGKAYGLAGLRLGFAVAHAELARRLREALGPWAVSGPAIAIGEHALADSAWLAGAIRRLSADAERLDRMLEGAGMTVIGGTPLFRLAQCPDPGSFTRLAEAGILVRPFARDPGHLRFGIPNGDAVWERLSGALCSSSTHLHR